ncbi:pyrroline-5-carboxylate reductase [Ensifer sp. 4252]|uniref:pyrroline-5-carboxylate reductase n=1 Tax=Ensifer sp. 4252 TaxID=3373915 RepID=UPI003D1CA62B
MILLLVGYGNLGSAMLSAWIDRALSEGDELIVVEPNDELREKASRCVATVYKSVQEIPEGVSPDLIVFSVKPEIVRNLLPSYLRFVQGGLFLSLAAGISIETFEEILGKEAAVVRCMVNTPASIGEGMMVFCANDNVSEEAEQLVSHLLAANGKVARLETEELMDAVTAVSGSGPAYVFHFIECLIAAGVKAGMCHELSTTLVLQTVYGAASLAAARQVGPEELRQRVTSPDGTTAAALAVLMAESGLQELVSEAVLAAKQRSIELA